MPDDDEGEDLRDRLLEERGEVPTSILGRLGRTAWAGWRARHLLRGKQPEDLAEAIGLVRSLGELKGISMKMGQILSYIDVALPEEVRDTLAVLQTHAQAMPVERVIGIVEAELGAQADPLIAELDPVPISAASIGQVHRSQLPDGTPVAVKVRYPEIQAAIESDFRAAGIGPRIAGLIYPGAPVEGFIREAEARFLEECDYEREARIQTRFGDLYADDPVITIPEVHPAYSTSQVLTTTYIDGDHLDAFLAGGPLQATRDRVGKALFRFYVGTLFEAGLYNGDPHPGNQLYLDDGRVAILDHGCARLFEPGVVADLARLTLAMHAGDRAALADVLVDMRIVPDRDPERLATAHELLAGFLGPTLTGGEHPIVLDDDLGMGRILDRKREMMRLQLPGSFLFLFRIRFGLMSVLARLGARADWQALEAGYAKAALARREGPS